jgi:hypothetical protein
MKPAEMVNARLVRSTMGVLHEELDRRLPKAIQEVLRAEMTMALEVVSTLTHEGRAFAELVEKARAWRAAGPAEPPHPSSIPIMPNFESLTAARRAAAAIETEAVRRAELTEFEQLVYGPLVPVASGPPPTAQWLAARAIGLAATPAELVLVEAILEGEGELKCVPSGATWWKNPRLALRRWTDAFKAAVAAEARGRKDKSRKT